ncbi:hypothetical protein F5Y12DRAFT_753998 [Xylaria sp. FL1777]|nr:hypothetical protein F5Y12DRAFT_753998 [Xylaria sp. FL1777]
MVLQQDVYPSSFVPWSPPPPPRTPPPTRASTPSVPQGVEPDNSLPPLSELGLWRTPSPETFALPVVEDDEEEDIDSASPVESPAGSDATLSGSEEEEEEEQDVDPPLPASASSAPPAPPAPGAPTWSLPGPLEPDVYGPGSEIYFGPPPTSSDVLFPTSMSFLHNIRPNI